MITTNATATEITTQQILRFIVCFRDFEKLPVNAGKLIISDMLCANTSLADKIPKITDQWRMQYNHFGKFWLGLDASIKIAFLRFWMFKMEGDIAYVDHIVNDPSCATYLKPPVLVRKLTNIIQFFEDHRIDDEMADAIDLPALPPAGKQDPGVASWSAFILSLLPYMNTELHIVLKTIRDFYPKLKMTNQGD